MVPHSGWHKTGVNCQLDSSYQSRAVAPVGREVQWLAYSSVIVFGEILRYTLSLVGSAFLPLDALFIFAMPTPEANLWDRRFASESIMVFWFVVYAKESTANDKDGLLCSS